MLSHYGIPPNSNKRKQKISVCEHELERPQLTLNDLERPKLTSEKVTNENFKSFKSKSKISVKGGSVRKNIEINGEY